MHLDLLVSQQAIRHDLGSAQFIAAVNHVNGRAKAREEERLSCRGISAAHYNDLLILEEESIACGAVGNTLA